MTFSASGATSNVPTGSKRITVDYGQPSDITIPNNVRVIQVAGGYIGVTPKKKYTLEGWIPFIHHTGEEGNSFLRSTNGVYWDGTSPQDYPDTIKTSYTIFWSPEINGHAPYVTDY